MERESIEELQEKAQRDFQEIYDETKKLEEELANLKNVPKEKYDELMKRLNTAYEELGAAGQRIADTAPEVATVEKENGETEVDFNFTNKETVDTLSEKLDAAVESGKITREQADKMFVEVGERLHLAEKEQIEKLQAENAKLEQDKQDNESRKKELIEKDNASLESLRGYDEAVRQIDEQIAKNNEEIARLQEVMAATPEITGATIETPINIETEAILDNADDELVSKGEDLRFPLDMPLSDEEIERRMLEDYLNHHVGLDPEGLYVIRGMGVMDDGNGNQYEPYAIGRRAKTNEETDINEDEYELETIYTGVYAPSRPGTMTDEEIEEDMMKQFLESHPEEPGEDLEVIRGIGAVDVNNEDVYDDVYETYAIARRVKKEKEEEKEPEYEEIIHDDIIYNTGKFYKSTPRSLTDEEIEEMMLQQFKDEYGKDHDLSELDESKLHVIRGVGAEYGEVEDDLYEPFSVSIRTIERRERKEENDAVTEEQLQAERNEVIESVVNDDDKELAQDNEEQLQKIEQQLNELQEKLDNLITDYEDNIKKMNDLIKDLQAALDNENYEELKQVNAKLSEIKAINDKLKKDIAEEKNKVDSLQEEKELVQADMMAEETLTPDEYREITNTLRNKEIVRKILKDNGIYDIYQKDVKERTPEEQEQLRSALREAVDRIAEAKLENRESSVLDLVQAIYNIEPEMKQEAPAKEEIMSAEEVEAIKQEAGNLPEVIVNRDNNTEISYDPEAAPEDMQEVMAAAPEITGATIETPVDIETEAILDNADDELVSKGEDLRFPLDMPLSDEEIERRMLEDYLNHHVGLDPEGLYVIRGMGVMDDGNGNQYEPYAIGRRAKTNEETNINEDEYELETIYTGVYAPSRPGTMTDEEIEEDMMKQFLESHPEETGEDLEVIRGIGAEDVNNEDVYDDVYETYAIARRVKKDKKDDVIPPVPPEITIEPTQPVITPSPTPTPTPPVEEEEEIEEEEKEDKTAGRRYTEVLRDVIEGTGSVSKKEVDKCLAGNIRCWQTFKDELHSGQKDYNVWHFSGAVTRLIGNGIRKLTSKLLLTPEAKEKIESIIDRLNKLEEDDIEILDDQYVGNAVLQNIDFLPINDLVMSRMAKWYREKYNKLNDEIRECYDKLFVILGEREALEEALKSCDDENLKAELTEKYNEIMSQGAEIVRTIMAKRAEGDTILGHRGLHGMEETFKAARTGMNYVGLRHRKKHDLVEEDLAKLAEFGEQLMTGLKSGNNQDIIDGFIGEETIYAEGTEITHNLNGDKSIGKKYYLPLLEEYDYRDDPYLKDLFATIAIVSATAGAINAIRVHNFEAHELLRHEQEKARLHNSQIDSTMGKVQSGAKEQIGFTDTYKEGMEFQANHDVITVGNSLERKAMDMTNWRFGGKYRALDDANHEFYNGFYDDVSSKINGIASRHAKGVINNQQSMNELIEVANSSSNTLVDVCKDCLSVMQKYSQSHPEFDLDGMKEALEYVSTHPNALSNMNDAIGRSVEISHELMGLSIDHYEALAQLPSDMLSTLMACAGSTALAHRVFNEMRSKGYSASKEYDDSITNRMRNRNYLKEDKEKQAENEEKPEEVEEKEEKDISQSTDINEILEELQRLNPNAKIEIVDTETIGSSIPAEELVLPEGFYYNEKNGITNKHNTKNGLYCSIDVVELVAEKAEEEQDEIDKMFEEELGLKPPEEEHSRGR